MVWPLHCGGIHGGETRSDHTLDAFDPLPCRLAYSEPLSHLVLAGTVATLIRRIKPSITYPITASSRKKLIPRVLFKDAPHNVCLTPVTTREICTPPDPERNGKTGPRRRDPAVPDALVEV